MSFANMFADYVKPGSVVDKLEGKAATSMGLNRLEKWVDSSLMELRKSCPYTDQSQAQVQTGHGLERKLCRKGSGGEKGPGGEVQSE